VSVPLQLLEALGPPPLDPAPAVVEMCEGVAGYYRYHLREPGKYKALCGRHVMYTGLSLEMWGFTGHMGESYCSLCKAMAGSP
jgi:hypothetical protein